MLRPTITLLTDFGHQDVYVGVMKGVLAERCPDANVVDLCHEIQPQNVAQAAYLLETSYAYFPAAAVHVVVVDPGVGTERGIVCLRTQGYTFLAPDNGVLGPITKRAAIEALVSVTNAAFFLDDVSATFHGRDIFAPVAAALASGVDLDELGPRIERVKALDAAEPKLGEAGQLLGQVIHVDRFGNLITNITADALRAYCDARQSVNVHVGAVGICGVSQTYADVGPGEWVALIGSTSRLEISVNHGDAARLAGCGIGAVVRIERG